MNFKTILKIAIPTLALSLSACSTGNLASQAPTCASQDWFEKGRQDGASGLQSKAENLQKTCGSFGEDSKLLYLNGHNAGMVEFCSATNAFKMGQMGTPKENSCPQLMKSEFEAAYKKGEESRRLKAQNEALAQRIQSLSQKINGRSLASEPEAEKASVTTQLEKLKRLYAQNEKKLSRISN